MKNIRLEIADEEAADLAGGNLPAHEVSPGVFLQMGLEIEEQQCVDWLRLGGSILVADRVIGGTYGFASKQRTSQVVRTYKKSATRYGGALSYGS